MTSILGRQPVSNTSYKIHAYDVLFRSDDDLDHPTNTTISASSLTRIMNDFGLENVIGSYHGFIRVDTDFLSKDIVFTIPKESFTLMILQSSFLDTNLPKELEKINKEGYQLGLNDTAVTAENFDSIIALLPYITSVKIDVLHSDPKFSQKLITILKAEKKTVIASKVETHELYDQYVALEVDYFQGFYIKRPYILKSSSFSSSQDQIFQVWNLLHADAATRDIVDALERNHALTLHLMQFINSSFFSFKNKISSVTQIVNLLGRNALGNWLLLLMVTTKNKDTRINHPLLLMVINRTEIMTSLLKLVRPNADRKSQETAYLVGMLSLIHLLFEIEHREFLHKLHISDEIEEAMFEAHGFWGQLLTLTRYIENADTQSIQVYIEKYDINIDDMNTVITEAMIKVNAFDEMMQDMF
ncbi:MAG: HDOD domain-containing protein [Campylobacterota bacterium]|nr:HDOD domain-containing protein [Campylobacterota bacterium]